jgi:hypothetical protein
LERERLCEDGSDVEFGLVGRDRTVHAVIQLVFAQESTKRVRSLEKERRNK